MRLFHAEVRTMEKLCNCGQKVRIEHKWNGLAWIPIFINPKTDDEIEHCKCGKNLWTAYRYGHLIEVDE